MNKKSKKILICCPFNPYDGNSGSRQDVRNRIDVFLELGYSVVLARFLTSLNVANAIEPDRRVTMINVKKRDNRRGIYYKRFGCDSRNAKEQMRKIIADHNPDLVWFEYFQFAHLASWLKVRYPNLPLYFRSHNYESGHVLEKILYEFQHKKNLYRLVKQLLRVYIPSRMLESHMFAVADRVYSISKYDIEKYARRFSLVSTTYLPFFAEYPSVQFSDKNKKSINVVFMGITFENIVNKSGLDQLVDIARTCEDAGILFHIIGNKVDSNVELCENMIHHGFVENLDEFMSDMDIGIVPVDIGFGMKIKVYELLKRGIPTIMTERSHRVFEGVEGETYIVARSHDDFCSSIRSLCNRERRHHMSESATSFMAKAFSKSEIIDTLRRV